MVDVVQTWNDREATTSNANNINLEQLHPLESEWTFWYDRRQQTNKRLRGEREVYESNLRPIGSFSTVEDFWRYYNHMVKPSKMENNANYHLFKRNIKPMWEDAANAKGGKWIITFKNEKGLLDQCWENLILAMIGETLDGGDEICGGVVSRRKAGDRIAVWNKTREDEEAILTIGRRLKTLLGIENKIQITYQNHEDSLRTGASYSNTDRYTL